MLSANLTQEALLHRIAGRIRQSLELQEILRATVAEVRSFLGSDRVKVYQFQPQGHGLVVAESVDRERLPSLLDLNFPADDIPPYARELFVQARQRTIVDVASHQVGISHLLDTVKTDNLSEAQTIRYRPIDPCHAEYLTAMGVKSSVVVPIVIDSQDPQQANAPLSLRSSQQLWGLLVSHHADPRKVTEQELDFLQAVVDQMSIAISQSMLLSQVREQARREASINQVTALLYTTLQAALEEAINVLQGSGGRLYLMPEPAHLETELYTVGDQPDRLDQGKGRPIEENLLWQRYLQSAIAIAEDSDQPAVKPWSVPWMRATYELAELPKECSNDSNIWVVNDLYREPLFRVLTPAFQSTQIQAVLIVPLRYKQEIVGCLTVFRNQQDQEIMWAGYHNPDTRQLMPRKSFEAWRQQKVGQALPWTEGDVKLAQILGDRFSMAIKQYRLYQKVQGFNVHLEHQVQARTADLQRSNLELQNSIGQQQAMATIVAKIRESLEVDVIFRTATHEVSSLLTADRVTVYQFHRDWSGEFLADYEVCHPERAGTASLSPNILPEQDNLQATQGGRYRHPEPFVVTDVYDTDYETENLEALDQFRIRAFIIAPIVVGQNLWGLLCVYQCAAPRTWQDREVEFVRQVSAQLGVALQHADLLGQTRHQARQLTKVVEHLKRIQLQLIHSEKMSSLGQLIAGIAHEINNPINFIYGNLTHIQECTETLLGLIGLYQQHYPHPVQEIQEQKDEADIEFMAEDLPKLCASLKVGAERIREIVFSLRHFSRSDQSEAKSTDIHEGLDSTLLILQHRLKPTPSSPGIQVVKRYGELPLVECYTGQLNQVFMNLLANAIDALEEQVAYSRAQGVGDKRNLDGQNFSVISSEWVPMITIATQELEGNRVQISIKDNGSGMTEEIRSKLFQSFFTTKPAGKGTGLGLSISMQIVEKHGGALHCLSEPGQGTEFMIEIPVKQPAPERSQPLHSTTLNSV